MTPDAFLTGVISISQDLRRLAVGIVAFDRQHAMEKVVEFDADADPFDLIDAGESFLLRGPLGDEEQQLAQVVMSANEVHRREAPHPLEDPDAPVKLQILYDNRSAPIAIRNGDAFVAEPRQGQAVSFVLRRKPGDTDRYALVLKVNGLNTLYKERLPELECRKWVLEPDRNAVTVTGFQSTTDKREAFRVLSKAASKQREMDYGADVGTISLAVFREGPVSPPAANDLLDDLAEDIAVLSRERFPVSTPRNLPALKAQLHRGDTRGLIAEGELIEGRTRKVKFDANPVPVMSVTITYYRQP